MASGAAGQRPTGEEQSFFASKICCVGGEVTVFSPRSEATALRLSDPGFCSSGENGDGVRPDIAGSGRRRRGGAGRELPAPEEQPQRIALVRDDLPCWVRAPRPSRRGRNPKRGRVIAQVGDEITGGGGNSDRDSGKRSRPVVLRTSNIKTLPHVEIYFPKQDGTLTSINSASKAPPVWRCGSAFGRSRMNGDTYIGRLTRSDCPVARRDEGTGEAPYYSRSSQCLERCGYVTIRYLVGQRR